MNRQTAKGWIIDTVTAAVEVGIIWAIILLLAAALKASGQAG